MKKILAVILLAAGLAACQSDYQSNSALTGGLIGAGTGAVIGGLATGRPGGAVAGAVIGGAGGALIGAASAQPPRYRRGYSNYNCRAYDYYGNPVRVAC